MDKKHFSEDAVKDVWTTISHQVLSSILGDPHAYFAVRDIVHGNYHWFPGKDQQVWMAMISSVEADQPPTVESVVLHGAGEISREYALSLKAQFNAEHNRNLVYITQQLKRLGMMAHLRSFRYDLEKLVDPDEVADMIDFLETQLAAIAAEHSNRDPSAKAVGDAAWNFTARIIPSGMKPFDDLAGGWWTSMNHWVVAAYKSGKSTIMKNSVLAAAKAGIPVSVFVAEGSRERLALDCQVMLAAGIMMTRRESDYPTLSSLKLMRSKIQPDTIKLTEEEWKALQVARDTWDRLPIRVYDQNDNITDLVTLRHLIRRDKIEHGTEAVFCDYSQLFHTKGETIYERQSTVAAFTQTIAMQQDVAFIMLSQRSEEGVKTKSSYSPMVKGGGDAPAAADFMFIPRLIEDDGQVGELPMMEVELKLSRHTQTGKWIHMVNAPSGLIIDPWKQRTRMSLDTLEEGQLVTQLEDLF